MPVVSFAGSIESRDESMVAGILREWLATRELDIKVRVLGWEIVFESPETYVYCYDAVGSPHEEAFIQGRHNGDVSAAEALLTRLAAILRARRVGFVMEYVPLDDAGNELGPEVRLG